MSLSRVVEIELQKSPFITEAMEAGLINISALSRYLHPIIEKKVEGLVSPSAINMAITRLPVSGNIQVEKSLSRFMEQLGDITVRSDLCDFSFKNSGTLMSCQVSLLKYLENKGSYFYSFCKGVNETTIICNESASDQVETLFHAEKQILTRKELAAVSIILPPDNLDTYGVYYTILKRLQKRYTWEGKRRQRA